MFVMLLVIGGGLYAVTHRGVSAAEAAYTPRPSASATATATATAEVATPEVTFSAVGDSVTEVNSPDFPAGQIGSDSWVSIAGGGGLSYKGGWAKGGATTKDMLNHVRAVPADVLVILAGTNDIAQNVPFATSSANLGEIATIVGAPRVVACSIPPTKDPAAATNYNTRLQAFAAEKKWEWVDCSAGLRNGDTYNPSLTDDGVHPNLAGEKLIASAIRQHLLPG